jgi:hypothetical protein
MIKRRTLGVAPKQRGLTPDRVVTGQKPSVMRRDGGAFSAARQFQVVASERVEHAVGVNRAESEDFIGAGMATDPSSTLLESPKLH